MQDKTAAPMKAASSAGQLAFDSPVSLPSGERLSQAWIESIMDSSKAL